jgi:hypothetical protein
MAEVTSGIFALIGTALGASLKMGGTRAATRQRANGRVLAQIHQARLLVERINYYFWDENERIEAATKKREAAAQSGVTEDKLPAIPLRIYRDSEDFKWRNDRIWKDVMQKAEEQISENMLQLSPKFFSEYWEFYRKLVIPGGELMNPYDRYQQAEKVFQEYEPKLTELAIAGWWQGPLYMTLNVIAGILIGAFAVAYWPDYAPAWLVGLTARMVADLLPFWPTIAIYIYIGTVLITVIPALKLLGRAGRSPWWAVLLVVPFFGFVFVVWLIAFSWRPAAGAA